MLPFVISGVVFAGLMFIDKLFEPSETWYSRKEYLKFQQEREQWINEGWMLFR